MELTDEELDAVYETLCGQYYYGRELVYEDSDEARAVSSAMGKMYAEFKKRGLR